MSDPTAPVTDTPPSTPTSDTPEIPWQKRYEDLRPEFDRTTQELAAERAAWDDEQALLARIAEKHPHLIAAEEEEDPEPFEEPTPEPVKDPRVDSHDAWIAQQMYERDLNKLVGDRSLTEQGREVVDALTLKGGNNAKALEAAVNRWFEITAPPEEEKPKPTAPHVLKGGKAATGGKAWHEMTDAEALAAQVEMAKAHASQT